MKLKTTLFLFINMLFAYQVSAQCNADFQEVNGIAILEMEAKSGAGFNNESLSGASAGRALAYRGSDRFGSPGSSSITYNVRINSPGTYRFIWRNRIGVIASGNANTEHNDAWLKINGSNFYGRKSNGSRVYPGGSGKSPVANGATSGGWFKVYTNIINWNWDTYTSDNDGHFIYADFNSAGTYTIQVSGRSNGHFVDRMVLYKEGSYSSTQARNLSRAQTTCTGGTPPPPPPPPPPTTPPANNIPPTVSFTTISNGQTFANGSTITVGLSSNDSDGSIAKHQVFVNGALVDTDGSSYSPYRLLNASAGNYTIKATVTDNSGASTSTSATITVGGSTTPPPPPPPPSTPPSGNAAPSVSFTNLTDNTQVAVGATVRVRLAASDSDGSIVKHQIFVNGTLVDTDGASYTAHTISNIKAGTYAIRATVTDNDGETASAAVSITVGTGTPTPPDSDDDESPTVSITNLSEGQQVAVGSTVFVRLSASDGDGRIVKYQIYVNGRLVDTDGTSYTAHPITNIQAGNYTIKATVTDNDGATDSDTVNITAGSGTTPPPPPTTGQISFSMINASTNGTIGAISNGTTFNSAQGVNIRAIAPSNANSVRISLSGTRSISRIENSAPYALYGDINGNYFAINLAGGAYTLRAIAYSGSGGTGSVIADTSISFSVSNSTSGKSAFAYPNPVKTDGKVSIKLPNGGSGDYKYSVSNALGVILETGQFNASKSSTDVDLELSNVGKRGKGVYYLSLISADSKQTIPIIRE